jgi:pimeloyl-ACP methyl ester carboxylesterase
MTDRGAVHHVYLIPGLFGFASLAGYHYFSHLERALTRRFADAGVALRLTLVPSLPTSSITTRAAEVARTVARTARDDEGPVHLIGHSSGGLDARLLLSPSRQKSFGADELDWPRRVRTLVSINTPHYGTPLAAYFATVSGTRLLYALSLLTVTTLSLGRAPLSALAAAVSAVRAVDSGIGLDSRIVDELTETVLRFVGERGRKELRDFLKGIQKDQAGIVQLMPEVAELFNATARDAPGVRYGSVVTSAPPPEPRRLLTAVVSPLRALQLALYTTLYGVASRADRRYRYATPDAEQLRMLERGLGRAPKPEHVDGVVPTLSMLWGDLLWCGAADHLDIVGHFEDDSSPSEHTDWLHSGAGFSREDFAAMMDAVCRYLLAG